jgi:opacity protein-like surface antigen
VKNSLLALAMFAALLMSAAAHAQSTQLKVTVPFEFIAGDAVLPAGDYDVQSVDTWGGKALSIHSMTSNAGTLLLSNSCQLAKTSDSNKLVFYRYGQKYFLAKVWTANTNIGREMPFNQRQRELAKNQQKSEVVLMASGKLR